MAPTSRKNMANETNNNTAESNETELDHFDGKRHSIGLYFDNSSLNILCRS